MNYEDLDPYIEPFLKKYGLFVMTKSHYDTPIRWIDIVDDTGKVYQITISIDNDEINITAWDKKSKGLSDHTTCTQKTFEQNLDKAYLTIESWIKMDGSSRTPIK